MSKKRFWIGLNSEGLPHGAGSGRLYLYKSEEQALIYGPRCGAVKVVEFIEGNVLWEGS